jgi:hypothetical protein
MIEDLIEGIACYCDTEKKMNALSNVCYTFKAPISIDNNKLSELSKYHNKTSEEIDRELRKNRIANKYEYNDDERKINHRYRHLDEDLFLDALQHNRDVRASVLKQLRKKGFKLDGVDVSKIKDIRDSLPDPVYELENRTNESKDRSRLENDLKDTLNTLGKKLKTSADEFKHNDHISNRNKVLLLGGGTLGGAGLGALIGDRISKKKGWSRTKGRVIGGLLGSGAGLLSSGVGGFMYDRSKHDNALKTHFDEYKKSEKHYIDAIDEANKKVNKYKTDELRTPFDKKDGMDYLDSLRGFH